MKDRKSEVIPNRKASGDICRYLQIFYHSTFLPVAYYRQSELLAAYPDIHREWDLTETFRPLLLQKGTGLDHAVSSEYLFYGIVRNLDTDEYIITGPVSTSRIRPRALPRILTESSISSAYAEQVENFLSMTPQVTFEQFICLLTLLYRELNGSLIDPLTYFRRVSTENISQIGQRHTTELYQAKEDENFHNTYQFELELLRCVENGDTAALETLFQKAQKLQAGVIGGNSLRQEKNILIASVTLLTRHSIAGGLDVETAYRLSDIYIQASEKAQTIDEVNRLNQAACMDFTNRVAACKIPKGISPDIFACIQYISTHTNQPVSVGDVANAVGKSRSCISRQFKKELGFNLSDFIMRRKLEEGRSLLLYSDRSISEISEYLCFSSQSYFQNVFKKKYGLTPLAFRKENQGKVHQTLP